VRRADGDYVLPVDKPVGPTSHDVVAMARRALRNRRIGHSGTLDPFASGLLLLCVGRATRIAEFLTGLDKRYVAVARLGVETDTLDLDGDIVAEHGGVEDITADQVRVALEAFRGAVEQVPPQFSAKKVSGEAMHRRARRGELVELAPVPVTVHDIELLDFSPPDVRFSVRCSSGTYIRAIARDLGRSLGTGAHLTALRRTAVGRFECEDALPLDALDDGGAVAEAAIEPAQALAHLGLLEVDAEAARRLGHGQRIRVAAPSSDGADGEPSGSGEGRSTLAVTCDCALLAVADMDDGVLRPRKVFAA
jgi:tRNA pseudouridine55 synthase